MSDKPIAVGDDEKSEARQNGSDRKPTEQTDVVLNARDVTRRFGTVTVLDDVTLSIPPESVVAVIGPNGSGKTTLLRVLVDDISPTSGVVEYRGPNADRPIGYLPQRPTFRPRFTALETLEFYDALVGGGDIGPSALLERVGLADASERRVDALSGGMRRLLGIAQAMVGDPPVVVLDEPASGLDPNMRDRVFEVTNRLAAGGRTVIVSSHDLAIVEETADLVVLLSGGSVVDTGSPEMLCERFDVNSLDDVFGAVTDDTGRVAVVGEGQ